jgi:hypothetical protein
MLLSRETNPNDSARPVAQFVGHFLQAVKPGRHHLAGIPFGAATAAVGLGSDVGIVGSGSHRQDLAGQRFDGHSGDFCGSKIDADNNRHEIRLSSQIDPATESKSYKSAFDSDGISLWRPFRRNFPVNLMLSRV